MTLPSRENLCNQQLEVMLEEDALLECFAMSAFNERSLRCAGTVPPYHHQAGFAAVAMKTIDPEKVNFAFNPLNSDHGEIDPLC